MTIHRLREVPAPTDPAILEAGAGGERLVARVRVVFWMAVWLIPVMMLLTTSAPPPEVWIGFGASSVAVAVSVQSFAFSSASLIDLGFCACKQLVIAEASTIVPSETHALLARGLTLVLVLPRGLWLGE